MRETLIRIFIVIFSAGWIIPLWISAFFYLSFIGTELRPYIMFGKFTINSAPYISFSWYALSISLIWLALVIVFWVWNVTEKK